MVARASATDRLEQGDAALEAALENLLDAVEAFRLAGRADLVVPIGTAVSLAREAELLRQTGAGIVPQRDPADWFLDD
jgi:hypothetical protein